MSRSHPTSSRQFLYVPDGSNEKVQILNRDTLEVVGFFGGHGGHGLDSSTTSTVSPVRFERQHLPGRIVRNACAAVEL